MNILPNKIESIQKASSDAFSVFTKTVDKLKAINESIKKEKEIRVQKSMTLAEEISQLDQQEIANGKIMNKITEIIS